MKFAVCDDEPVTRQELKRRIDAFMKNRGCGWEVAEFDSAAVLLADPAWDIIFLDIQLPGLNGMEAAKQLREMGWRGRLVLTTILRDYVFDAFAVEADDYLVKPIDDGRFCRMMERLTDGRYAAGMNLVIRCREETNVVPYREIAFCEIRGRKIDVHTADRNMLRNCRKLT